MSTTLDSNRQSPRSPTRRTRMDHLDWLEAESIHILRELVAECSKPALPVFGRQGFGSSCSHLALEGVRPRRRLATRKLPFPLVHIDTGHNFDEVIDFRDRRAKEIGAELVVGHVEDSIKKRHRAPASARRIRATRRKR